MPDADVSKTAKEFIDRALAARGRLGYSAKVSKKSYGRAVEQAADVFGALQAQELISRDALTGPRKNQSEA
jgi:hypothetical protein